MPVVLHVVSSDGVFIPVDSLSQTYTYSGDLIATASVVWNGVTYTQTFNYTNGKLTNPSDWVPV